MPQTICNKQVPLRHWSHSYLPIDMASKTKPLICNILYQYDSNVKRKQKNRTFTKEEIKISNKHLTYPLLIFKFSIFLIKYFLIKPLKPHFLFLFKEPYDQLQQTCHCSDLPDHSCHCSDLPDHLGTSACRPLFKLSGPSFLLGLFPGCISETPLACNNCILGSSVPNAASVFILPLFS